MTGQSRGKVRQHLGDARPRPSESFISLTRNIELAKKPPQRFEPTIKAEGDVVL